MTDQALRRRIPDFISPGLLSRTDMRPRLVGLDLARGSALVGMTLYHLVWDLGFLGFIAAGIPEDPRFKAFGHAIAAAFLLIVGVSLALATRNGLSIRAYLARLLRIALAAAAVTLATWLFTPHAFIFFGILHCILVASLLALPLLRAPMPVVLAVAVLFLVAPLAIAHPLFDQPVFWWSGLGTHEPVSNDWRPVFPWCGIVFLGLALGRVALSRGLLAHVSTAAPRDPARRAMAFAGRHSLAYYLAHQPLMLALLVPLGMALGTHPVGQNAPFLRACERSCSAESPAAYCRRVCACVADRAGPLPLWRHVLENRLTEAERAAFNGVAAQCTRSLRPQP